MFFSSQDGDSGRNDMPIVSVEESMQEIPSEVRHPFSLFFVPAFVTKATKIPSVSISWYNDESMPRTRDGDTSAVYL